ncbi:MAG: SUMF1/EgtB/PvdO family nonheme iron enzyme [Candidatus Hydrogenedentes bacterium]|nr:SUMF1/EgtB/PvdO family nonheme iron enzyme [Candidatus Hydrogenedentota bacterium]
MKNSTPLSVKVTILGLAAVVAAIIIYPKYRFADDRPALSKSLRSHLSKSATMDETSKRGGGSIPKISRELVKDAEGGSTLFTFETAFIEGGIFTMGNPLPKSSPDWHADEPLVTISVESFRMSTTPVTATQFCRFLNSIGEDETRLARYYKSGPYNDYRFSPIFFDDADGVYRCNPGAEDTQANQVTWLGAVRFCQWLSQLTGKHYRLPSEAEWEYAARGQEGRLWPWGDESPSEKHGFINGMRIAPGSNRYRGMPVGHFPANATPDGVLDLISGITGEWCAGEFVSNPSPDQANVRNADEDNLEEPRVVRGYYHRLVNRRRGNLISWFLLGDIPHHEGRVWTRVGCDPIEAPQQASRHAFRVVEDLRSLEWTEAGR